MIVKILKTMLSLLIVPFRLKIFDPNKIFKGKKVAVVGAADSALIELNGTKIDSYDFVIRINKAIICWNKKKEKNIGQRTDVLFHSFYENEDRGGGGKLNFDLFSKRGVKYLVQPFNNNKGKLLILNFYRKYLKTNKVYILRKKDFYLMDNLFKGTNFIPTIGFCAIYAVLTSSCEEVFLTGFTFFKTPYALGYRDDLMDMNANMKHFKKYNLHDPNLEFENFKILLDNTSIKKIRLDNSLFQILENEKGFPKKNKKTLFFNSFDNH